MCSAPTRSSETTERPQAAPPAHPLPAHPPRRRAPGPRAALHGPAGGVPGGSILTLAAQEAARADIALRELLGPRRTAALAAARHRAMARAWRETSASMATIARVFNRSPSAVSRAIRAVTVKNGAR